MGQPKRKAAVVDDDREKVVISYLRYSSMAQEAGTSIARQTAYAEKWAAAHGMRLDVTLRDEGRSAYKEDHVSRGKLGRFLDDVAANKIPRGSVLIVEALDRLSRAKPTTALAQLTQIIEAGIRVVTAKDEAEYSAESLEENQMKLVFSLMLMIRAHEESFNKARHSRDALHLRCKAWLAGDRTHRLHAGSEPAWIRADGTKRVLVPELAAAVRAAVDLYMRGFGTTAISAELTRRKLKLTRFGSEQDAVLRTLANRALIGEKAVTVSDPKKPSTQYVLPDYYPALLTLAEWQALQDAQKTRAKGTSTKGTVPHILTGFRSTTCGHCGCAFVAHVYNGERGTDGLIPDSVRRMRCSYRIRPTINCLGGPGSVPAAPLERAIMEFCSDLMNLKALYGADREAAPRAVLASARSRKEKLEQEIDSLAEEVANVKKAGGTGSGYTKRMVKLEAEQQLVDEQVVAAKAELARVARADLVGLDERWAALADGVLAQETDARVQARQLVIETFDHIQIYAGGSRLAEAPAGMADIVLRARGSEVERMLHIDATGEWREVLVDEYRGSAVPPDYEEFSAARRPKKVKATA